MHGLPPLHHGPCTDLIANILPHLQPSCCYTLHPKESSTMIAVDSDNITNCHAKAVHKAAKLDTRHAPRPAKNKLKALERRKPAKVLNALGKSCSDQENQEGWTSSKSIDFTILPLIFLSCKERAHARYYLECLDSQKRLILALSLYSRV